MAILAECPVCHRKQANKNKHCSCGEHLAKAKRSKRVRYWINYRLPGGKQRREAVGFSIEDARDADSKRRIQKRENRFFEMTLDFNMTFSDLTEWYLDLNSVKKLNSYARYQSCIANFNSILGDCKVSMIKPIDLEEYQDTRESQGAAPATIDIELVIAGGMVRKAWDNDLVNDRPVKAFRKIKNRLKLGANARNRTLTMPEYGALIDKASEHVKALVIAAYHTGMRRGELLNLKWSHIDRKNSMIRLPAEMTKEKRLKNIPLNHHVKDVLSRLPRATHHDYVFTYKTKPIRREIRIGLMKACENAGIKYGLNVEGGFRFHDLRATFKTNMLRAGVDKVLRDTIVGHTLKGMDAYYLKPGDDDLHGAMEKFTTWIDSQIASVDQSVDQVAVNQP